MPAGLPFGTISASTLVVKVTGLSRISPAELALRMFASSADANTSAGAPALSWSTNAAEPSKEVFTVTPGFAASNSSARVARVGFRDDAANTTSSVRALAVGLQAVSTRAAATPSSSQALTGVPRCRRWWP